MTPTKILVAQGGGPTAVINQSLAGVVLEARRFPNVTRVYGAHHGVRGIVNEDLLDLTQETSHNLERVAGTPSSALGSTRDKPDAKYCHDIFQVLRAHEIGALFYIGGNDSSDTVRIVSEEANKANYPLRSIHIPKTIDNDLVANDHATTPPATADPVIGRPHVSEEFIDIEGTLRNVDKMGAIFRKFLVVRRSGGEKAGMAAHHHGEIHARQVRFPKASKTLPACQSQLDFPRGLNTTRMATSSSPVAPLPICCARRSRAS